MASWMCRFAIACVLSLTAFHSSAQEVGESLPEAVSPVTAGRTVLTPHRTLVVEPSMQYIQSSTTQVAIEGFTVIPAIAIGLINVEEVQRNSFIVGLGARYGLTDRLEAGVKVPWVWRDEQSRQREVLQGSDLDMLEGSDGEGLGDVEFGLRYQLNRGVQGPVAVANLRVKSDSGRSPFSVSRRPMYTEDGTQVGETFREQPTGSGFWGVQPSLTFIIPSDPAVLHGSISYLWNIGRDVGGDVGRVDPGDAVGLSVGMGLAVNDRTSISLGYDHTVVGRTHREHDQGMEPAFKRIHVGTALLGFTHRLRGRRSISLGIGIGATSSAPDVQVSIRLPTRYSRDDR